MKLLLFCLITFFYIGLINSQCTTITCPADDPNLEVNNPSCSATVNSFATSDCQSVLILNDFFGGDYPIGDHDLIWMGIDENNVTPVVGSDPNVPHTIYDTSTNTETISITTPGFVDTVIVEVDTDHTFIGDVELFLTSPQGTTVTLLDNQCGVNDDIHGIYSDAGSPIDCYNPGVHQITQPVGNLSDFFGEPFLGDWDLTFVDNSAGISGTIEEFNLYIIPLPGNLAISDSDLTVPHILDSNLPSQTTIINVPQTGGLTSLTVELDVDHTWIGDVEIDLTSPQGTTVELLENPCGNVDGLHVLLSDDGSPIDCNNPYNIQTVVPQGNLSDFIGEEINGDWTLTFIDEVGGDTGTIETFTLNFEYLDLNNLPPSSTQVLCTQFITVEDTIAPAFTCPNPIVENNDPGACSRAIDAGTINPAPTDLCPIVNIIDDGTVTYGVGTTNEFYSATDSSGNEESCNQSVTIVDAEDPVITSCPNDFSISTDNGFCDVLTDPPNASFNDNCAVTSTTPQPANTIYPLGANTFSITASDAAGNSETCSYIMTVIDNENPTITCPISQQLNTANGLCTANPPNPININDNCPGVSFSTNPTNVPLGTNQFVVYTVSDNAGNTNTCGVTFEVIDNQAPTITCPPDVFLDVSDFSCNSFFQAQLPTVNDNCPVTITNDFNNRQGVASGTFPVGTTTVTYTVEDSNPVNTQTCSFDVTVTDNNPPVVTCPDDITVNANREACTASVQVPNPTVFESCPFTITNDFNGGSSASDFYPVGVTRVTFTVNDNIGNVETCNMRVNVCQGVRDTSITLQNEIANDN